MTASSPIRSARIAVVVLAGLLMLAAASPAAAMWHAGGLDRQFGSNGRVIGPPNVTFPFALAMITARDAVAGDGSVYAAYQTRESSLRPTGGYETVAELRHYLRNGRLDPAFGDGGSVQVAMPPGLGLDFTLTDLAVDSAGRPLLFGKAVGVSSGPASLYGHADTESFAALLRFGIEGKLDPSFGGGDGVALFDFGLPPAPGWTKPEVSISHGAIAPDGQIVLAASEAEEILNGFRGTVSHPDRLVAGLSADGSLDAGFGDNGVVALPERSYVHDLAVDRERRVSVLVAPLDGPDTLLRLQANGAPDAGFGRQGRRGFPAEFELQQLAVDRFGRTLLLAPQLDENRRGGVDQHILRIGVNGALDRSFGRDGVATVHWPANSYLAAIAADRSGRVLVTGVYFVRRPHVPWREWDRAIGVARLTQDGRRDPSFGSRGLVATRFGAGAIAGGNQLAFDGYGHLVVGGVAQWKGDNELSQVLARYELRRR